MQSDMENELSEKDTEIKTLNQKLTDKIDEFEQFKSQAEADQDETKKFKAEKSKMEADMEDLKNKYLEE